MKNIETIAANLFDKIRSRFDAVNIGDKEGQTTQDPAEARFFNFDYVSKNGDKFGNITVSIVDGRDLKIYFGKNITEKLDDAQKEEWYSFLRNLRMFAKRNMMTFDTRDISRGNLEFKDVRQASVADSTFDKDDVNESLTADDFEPVILETQQDLALALRDRYRKLNNGSQHRVKLVGRYLTLSESSAVDDPAVRGLKDICSRLDQRKNVKIKVGSQIVIISVDIHYAEKLVEIFSFKNPKTIQNIVLAESGKIDFIEFTDGTQFPENHETDVSAVGAVFHTMFFPGIASSKNALTMIALAQPGPPWKTRHIVNENIIREFTETDVQKHNSAMVNIFESKSFLKDSMALFHNNEILSRPPKGYVRDNNNHFIKESKLYGKGRDRTRSYQDIGKTTPVKLVIKHTSPVDEDRTGSRSRHIASVFVETADGERFKLPFTNLTGARAMGNHISHGGQTHDGLGSHISHLVQKMNAMRKFVRAAGNKTFEGDDTAAMVESATAEYNETKETLHRLKGPKGYKQFVGDFKPEADLDDSEVNLTELKDKFSRKVFDDRLEEALPMVYKAHAKRSKMKESFPYDVDHMNGAIHRDLVKKVCKHCNGNRKVYTDVGQQHAWINPGRGAKLIDCPTCQGGRKKVPESGGDKKIDWTDLDESLSINEKLNIFSEYYSAKGQTITESNDVNTVEYFSNLSSMSDKLTKNSKFLLVFLGLINNKIIKMKGPEEVIVLSKNDNVYEVKLKDGRVSEFPSSNIEGKIAAEPFFFNNQDSFDKFRTLLILKFNFTLPEYSTCVSSIDEGIIHDFKRGREADKKAQGEWSKASQSAKAGDEKKADRHFNNARRLGNLLRPDKGVIMNDDVQINEIGFADELGNLSMSESDIISQAREDGKISQMPVMVFAKDKATMYFFKDEDKISALVLLSGHNLKAIKNLSNEKGKIFALLNYIVSMKNIKLTVTPSEPLTIDGFKWIAKLLNSPSGLKVTNTNGDQIDMPALKAEWEKSKAARGTWSGPSGIVISEVTTKWKNRLIENERSLMPFIYFKPDKKQIKEADEFEESAKWREGPPLLKSRAVSTVGPGNAETKHNDEKRTWTPGPENLGKTPVQRVGRNKEDPLLNRETRNTPRKLKTSINQSLGKHSKSKLPEADEFEQFMNQTDDNATDINPHDMSEFKEILSGELPVGSEGINVLPLIGKYLTDEDTSELEDAIYALSEVSPDSDAAPVIKDWIRTVQPSLMGKLGINPEEGVVNNNPQQEPQQPKESFNESDELSVVRLLSGLK